MNVAVFVKSVRLRGLLGIRGIRHYATAAPEESKFPEETFNQDQNLQEPEDDPEENVRHIRNKSRLNIKHYRIFHKKAPPLSEDEKISLRMNRLRRMYGEYGSASGIDVGLLWPSKEEMELDKEKEEVTYPDNIHVMIAKAKAAKEEEERAIKAREEDLDKKMAKLEVWKKEVRDRMAKQEKLAKERKESKEKLMEEIRQMFGFKINPKDPRFKKALEDKEEAEKKAAKAAKKLKRQQRVIAELKKIAQEGKPESTEKNEQPDGSQKTKPDTSS